ncbi:MAG: VOC family protein [Pseudomonadota bacterium]
MIVPNLMVSDMPRAVAFWRDALGFRLVMTVDAARRAGQGTEAKPQGAVFAVLERGGDQIMLQTAESLAAELPVFDASAPVPPPSGALYLQDYPPEVAAGRLPPGAVLKGPERAWYGMRELYAQDPDGHVICLAVADGPSPG